MNRPAQLAQKRTPSHMTNVDTITPATVAEQGAHVAPAKASSKKQAAAKKGALKARKPAKGAKPKKPAGKTTKARPGSKSAKVLELLARTNGASLGACPRIPQGR